MGRCGRRHILHEIVFLLPLSKRASAAYDVTLELTATPTWPATPVQIAGPGPTAPPTHDVGGVPVTTMPFPLPEGPPQLPLVPRAATAGGGGLDTPSPTPTLFPLEAPELPLLVTTALPEFQAPSPEAPSRAVPTALPPPPVRPTPATPLATPQPLAPAQLPVLATPVMPEAVRPPPGCPAPAEPGRLSCQQEFPTPIGVSFPRCSALRLPQTAAAPIPVSHRRHAPGLASAMCCIYAACPASSRDPV